MFDFMTSPKLFLLLCLIVPLVSRIKAQSHFCLPNNYTEDSTYYTNVRLLLSYLSSNASQSDDGFYNTTVGGQENNPNTTVYGLFQCHGDANVQTCQKCVSDGVNHLLEKCPNNTGAVGWYEKCWLHFSGDEYIFSKMQEQPQQILASTASATDTNSFMNLLGETLRVVAREASQGGSKKYETKEVNYSSFQTLYTMAQCTQDINDIDCLNCLDNSISNLPICCNGNVGGVTLKPSCYLKYEIYAFYQDVPQPPPAIPQPNPSPEFTSKGKHNDHTTTTIVAVFVTVVSVMLFCFVFYYWKREQSNSYKTILKKNFGMEGAALKSLRFNLATIEAATDKFSIENRIGKGGFGEVYMGILPDGSKIAVKRLSKNSSQGLLEFKNEVLLIAKLQHRNLVALLGFCLKDQEKILVYEYVPNKSLDYFLFGSQKSRVLNWLERYKIIAGLARGILYLHEHSRLKVIHRDLKPSNILLDDEMNPKISDFGMARMVCINEARGSTNRIVGTLGYMSPEYIKFGLFSEKSDVFSFGVIVLEIVSGKSINSQCESLESQYAGGLLSDAWKHWRDEKLLEILDSNLTEAESHSEIIKCIHIGLLCVQGSPHFRPSMNEVVQYLNNDSMQFPIPQEPAFFMHSQLELEAPTRAIMEARLGNHSQYSINEMSESTSFPR